MFLRVALLVLRKDFAIEVRSREILYTTLFFALSCVLIFSFAFVKAEGQPLEDAAAGILWIAIAFAGTLALGRTFEREPLAQPARKSRDLVVAPIAQPRRVERPIDRLVCIQPIELRKKSQILARGQFRVQVQLVRQEADSLPQRRRPCARRVVAVVDTAAGWSDQRREDAEEGRLPGAVGTKKADDLTRPRQERNLPEGSAPSVVP